MGRVTKEDFVFAKKEINPLLNKLKELEITFEDLDINERIPDAERNLRDFLTELWYSYENKKPLSKQKVKELV